MAAFTEDIRTAGELAANTIRASNGRHGESQFDSTTGRRLATGVIHEHKVSYRLPDGADVTAFDIVLEAILRTAEIVEVCVWPEVAPTGGDKAYTVDIHRSVAAAAFASIMSATVAVSVAAGSANRTAQYGTIDSTKKDVSRGDALKIVVAVSGTTGSQGQGGVITIKLREHPDA